VVGSAPFFFPPGLADISLMKRGYGMKTSWAALLAIGLAACASPPPKAPSWGPDDLRDNAIAANAAEPPWRDLARHTMVFAPGRAIHPGASPKGDRVAYATSEFGARAQIAMKDVDGAAAYRLSAGAGDHLFPRISPCGKKVAYASNTDGNWEIYLCRLDAPSAVTQVTFDDADDIAPSWSPDGRKLVYCSRAPGSTLWQLVLVDVGSRLKTYLGAGVYPDWSPDAKDPWIAFQSQPREAGGRSGVWVVRPDGRGLREIVGDKARVWSAIQPRFSPDGRWIAYATINKSAESRAFGTPETADDVWIVRPDGTLDTRLTDDLSGEWWPCWGGDRVFFVSDRGGAPNIWSVRVKPLEDAAE
jgi:Tol biopolymer transport system component